MTHQLLKKLAFSALASSPRLRIRQSKLLSAQAITVLNFHRIAPFSGSTYSGISPKLFDEIIGYLKKHFHICLFNDVNLIKASKPKLIVSFDDGYKDFIDYAAPILDKHKVQVNQNIIPVCVDTGLAPINVMLQDFIGKAPVELLNNIPLNLDFDGLTRAELGRKASFAIKYLPEQEFKICKKELQRFLTDYPEYLCASMLTKEDVVSLSSVHEIGAHSFEHLSMGNQSIEYFKSDLSKCREYFANELQIDSNIYAFPNGSATKEQICLAQKSGFDNVLLVGDKYSCCNNTIFNRFTFAAKNMQEAKYKAFGRRVVIK